MPHRMMMFAIVSFTPVLLITMAAINGGWWVGVACFYITAFTFMLDHLTSIVGTPEDATSEFPAADGLSVVLAVSHFGLLPLVVWALSSNSQLEVFDTLGVFVATGLFIGQVSNSNAHELIHRSDRRLFCLGKWVYISMLYGHHTSAHLLVHHRFAASERDPCSAPKGESFYAFTQRAWIGSASAGFEMESRRLENRPTVSQRFSHPYYSYTFGGAASVLGAFLIGGWGGIIALTSLAIYAQIQLLLSDYVQHYGLRRTTMPNGKLAPVGMCHSWNAPHWMSTYLMLAAPRHSDHHAHPAKPYPALEMPAANFAPNLPYSLPVMAVIALYPRLWRRVMDPRVAYWIERAEPHAHSAPVQTTARQKPGPSPLQQSWSSAETSAKTAS